jgi:hypothetical protein
MSTIIPGPSGVAKIVAWPAMHRRIFFRPEPLPGGLPSEVVNLKGHDPLGRSQIIHMAGGAA